MDVNQAQRRSSNARRVTGRLSYSFISPIRCGIEWLLSSIMSNPPFEAQGEEKGDARGSQSCDANGFTRRVHGGRNTEGREGWGNFVGLTRVITGLGELWELLDRI
jgi:hypothetical protein